MGGCDLIFIILYICYQLIIWSTCNLTQGLSKKFLFSYTMLINNYEKNCEAQTDQVHLIGTTPSSKCKL